MDRRRFLAAAGSAGLFGLAGCATASRGDTADGVAPPPVPDHRLRHGGWVRYDDWVRELYSRSVVVGALTATGHTEKYEDRRLRRRVRTDTLGTVDEPLRVFFATRVGYDPGIDDVPLAREEVFALTRRRARERFVDALEGRGVAGVRPRGSETIRLGTGERADLFTYRGEYRFETIEIPLRGRATLTIRGGALPIAGAVAAWRHAGDTLIAGGAYPAADFERRTTTRLSDAVELTVSVDLGLRPGRYRDELRALVRAVG